MCRIVLTGSSISQSSARYDGLSSTTRGWFGSAGRPTHQAASDDARHRAASAHTHTHTPIAAGVPSLHVGVSPAPRVRPLVCPVLFSSLLVRAGAFYCAHGRRTRDAGRGKPTTATGQQADTHLHAFIGTVYSRSQLAHVSCVLRAWRFCRSKISISTPDRQRHTVAGARRRGRGSLTSESSPFVVTFRPSVDRFAAARNATEGASERASGRLSC